MSQRRVLLLLWTVLVVVFVGYMVYAGLDDEASPPVASPAPSASLPDSVSPSVGDTEFEEGAMAGTCEGSIDEIRERSTALAIEWFKLLPSDTFDDRAARLKPYVTDDFLSAQSNKEQIMPDMASSAEQARVRQGITQLARATDEEIRPVCSSDLADLAATDVTVSVWTQDLSGRTVLPPSPSTLSITWQYLNQAWKATSVTE